MEIALAERLGMEWPTIAAAPYTHWLLLLLILVVATGMAHFWNKKQIDDANSARDLAKDRRDEAEAKNKELKEETEKLAKTIAELTQKAALTPAERLGFTSTVMQETVLEVVKTETHQLKFYGQVPAENLALYTRAQELGVARIDRSPPTATTVTATVSMPDLEEALRWARGLKGPDSKNKK